MSVLTDVLKQEKRRLAALALKYEKELKILPKGKVYIKKRKDNDYYYLAFRLKTKVKFIYLGKAGSEKLREVNEKLARRTAILAKLKQVKEELKQLAKVVK
jgi:hypothetical protein